MKKEESSSLVVRLATEEDVTIADLVSDATAEDEGLLFRTREELLELYAQGRGVVVCTPHGELVSHAALSFIYNDGKVEVGTVYTNPDHRGKGGAKAAVTRALTQAGQLYPNTTIFAMANENSVPMFTKMGGVVIECLADGAVYDKCVRCPKRSGRVDGDDTLCRHTPIDLTLAAGTLIDNTL